MTEVSGAGPAVAAAVPGDVRDISRFPGPGLLRRLQRHRAGRGVLRQPHHLPAVAAREPAAEPRHPQAAVTQIRRRHTNGRAYYDKKIAAGKTAKEVLRALKRQVSDALYQHMKAGARRAAAAGPGGHPGNGSVASAAGSHPGHRLFGQATPGPDPTLRSRPGPLQGHAPWQPLPDPYVIRAITMRAKARYCPGPARVVATRRAGGLRPTTTSAQSGQ